MTLKLWCFLYSYTAWQCVLRDIRSTQNSERNDRGPQEYVEKNPNPNLHCKLQWISSSKRFCSCMCQWFTVFVFSYSFHTSGPEWPQETQHTGLQEVLVFLVMVQELFSPVILENFLYQPFVSQKVSPLGQSSTECHSF